MSGLLTSIGGAAGGGLASSVLGLLQTASWRGVTIDVLDSRHSAGRRWAQFLFPGRPDTLQEDMGAVDGPIALNALVIGPDWLSRQRRLEAACKAAGPGMLLHPWLGPIKVTLSAPAEFGFDHQKQGLCTVSLQFQVWSERVPPAPTTLGGLLDRIDAAVDAAQGYLAGVLAPLGDALGLVGLAESTLGQIAGVWDGLVGAAGAGPAGGALAAATAAPLDALSGGVALIAGAGLAPQLAGLTEAVPAALSLAADSAADPAIGPGPLEPDPPPQADPLVAASVLLAALPALQPQAGALPLPAAVLLVARTQAVCEAARAASGAVWSSRAQAVAWRAQVDAALASVQAELASGAGPAWRAVRDVRSAWARDMTEAIGRLLPARYVQTFAPLSAWQLALLVAGDDPAAIRPALLDIVARNRIRHPGWVPPGRYEVSSA